MTTSLRNKVRTLVLRDSTSAEEYPRNFDGGQAPSGPLPGDNIRLGSIVLSALLTLTYALEIVFLALISTSEDPDEDISWSIAPLFTHAIVITSIAFGTLLNPMAFLALLRKSRDLSSVSFWFSILVIVLNSVVFIVLLMRGSGAVVISSQGEAKLDTFTEPTQNKIVQFAMDKPESWSTLQSQLGECCGLNFRSTYADQLFDIDNFNLDVLLSNPQCNQGRPEIDQIHAEFPVFSEAALQRAEESELLSGKLFFCEEFLASEVKGKTQAVATVFGVATFVQVILLFCLGLMIYSYTESEGGFKPDEDSLESRPKVQNTVLVRAGYNQGSARVSQQRAGQGYDPGTARSRALKF